MWPRLLPLRVASQARDCHLPIAHPTRGHSGSWVDSLFLALPLPLPRSLNVAIAVAQLLTPSPSPPISSRQSSPSSSPSLSLLPSSSSLLALSLARAPIAGAALRRPHAIGAIALEVHRPCGLGSRPLRAAVSAGGERREGILGELHGLHGGGARRERKRSVSRGSRSGRRSIVESRGYYRGERECVVKRERVCKWCR